MIFGARVDDEIKIGQPLAWLSDTPGAPAPESPNPSVTSQPSSGRLVSRDAAALLDQHALSVDQFPGTGPIRKCDVDAFLRTHAGEKNDDWSHLIDRLAINENSTLIFGAKAQGAVVLECLEATQTRSACVFVDDHPNQAQLLGIPVVTSEALVAIRERGVKRAHVSIAAAAAKLACARRLEQAGFEIVSVTHPSSVLSPSARMGKGVFLGPLTLVGAEAVLEDFVQVNNGASIAHHCVVGTAARLSDGARLAGSVRLGECAFLGIGVTVNEKIEIGARSTVVSGVSVFNHVPPDSIVRTDGKAYPTRTRA